MKKFCLGPSQLAVPKLLAVPVASQHRGSQTLPWSLNIMLPLQHPPVSLRSSPEDVSWAGTRLALPIKRQVFRLLFNFAVSDLFD